MQYGRDWFIETLPEVIELVALGESRGESIGELKTLRQEVVRAVQVRYPTLQRLAEEYVCYQSDPEQLRRLIPLIYLATSERAVRQLLQEIPPLL